MFNANYLIIGGIVIIFLGIVMIFLGTALQAGERSSSDTSSGEVKTGGVIMIGPIPIIFGSDKGFTIVAVILALILMVVSYLLFYR